MSTPSKTALGERLVRGVFWSFIGAAVSRGLALLASIVVARLLGKKGFGELGMIQSTVGMFGVFAGFGMGVTATKYVAELRGKDPARAGRIIGLSSLIAWCTGALMGLTLVCAAPWLASHALAAPNLTFAVRVSGLLLLFSAVNGAQTGALAGFEAFRIVAGVNLCGGLLSFPITVGLAYMFSTEGAIFGLTASTGIGCFLNYLGMRRAAARAGVPLGYKGCTDEWPVVFAFSLPAVMAGALVMPAMWGAAAVLVNQPSGYSEMGIYSAVSRIKQLPEVLLSFLIAPMLPVLSERRGARDIAGYNKTLSSALFLSAAIAAPLMLLLTAVPQLTYLVYGEDYGHNALVVQLLMLHGLLSGTLYPMGAVFSSLGRMWLNLVVNMIWAALFFGLSVVFVPRWGASGLAGAYALTYSVTFLPSILFLYRAERGFLMGGRVLLPVGLSLGSYAVCILSAHSLPTAGSAFCWVCCMCLLGYWYFIRGKTYWANWRNSRLAVVQTAER